MKEKGIEDAVAAVKSVNEDLGFHALSLDIYGAVDGAQVEWFENLKKNFPFYVQYKGMANPEESVDIVKNYFALLFPTYYEGEGFAGTLLDAYSSGVPVIATDWRYNTELVSKETGFVYPTGDQEEFLKILNELVANPTLVLSKKKSCIKEAYKYQSKSVIAKIEKQIIDK